MTMSGIFQKPCKGSAIAAADTPRDRSSANRTGSYFQGSRPPSLLMKTVKRKPKTRFKVRAKTSNGLVLSFWFLSIQSTDRKRANKPTMAGFSKIRSRPMSQSSLSSAGIVLSGHPVCEAPRAMR